MNNSYSAPDNSPIPQEDESKNLILAVDDEENNLNILESYLSDAGYDVVTAINGKEALDFMNIFGDDVAIILLDRMMPEMDGIEFLKNLKGHRKHYDVPVIMQTAAAMPTQVKEGIDLGVYSYLKKPFSEDKVIKLVEQAMSGKRNIRVMRKQNKINNNQNIELTDPDLFKNL